MNYLKYKADLKYANKPQKDQTKQNIPKLSNQNYQTKFTKPNLPDLTKHTKANLPKTKIKAPKLNSWTKVWIFFSKEIWSMNI